MKTKWDEVFSVFPGMVSLESHCNNIVAEFKSLIIAAIDPKFEQLRQPILPAPGGAPFLEHATNVVEFESYLKDIAKRLELLEASVIQIRTTTAVAVTELRSVIVGSGPAHAPTASPAAASSAVPWRAGMPDPMAENMTRGASS